MKIKVNKEFCIGCGLCEELVPEVFQLKGERIEVIMDDIPETLVERIGFAIEDCPGNAIQPRANEAPGL